MGMVQILQALKPKIKNNKDEVECVFIFWKWYNWRCDLTPFIIYGRI
jgi:hypothetical protein